MKAVHPSYTFVASTKTITLTGLNIDQDQLLLIVNATRGVQYFNFADSSLRGTVTPGSSTTVVLTDASTTGHSNSDALVIYYDDQTATQAVSGTVTANPGTGAFTVSGTVGLDNASLVALENITVTVGPAISGTVTVANFPASQTIAGTVTANVPIISGEVGGASQPNNAVQIGYYNGVDEFVGVNNQNALPISGTVTANGRSDIYDGINDVYYNKSVIAWGNPFLGEPTLVEQSTPLPISGTVTANNPSGALTTRFGSVVTANLATLTSAVTNTSRKFLLVQNIATSTVTIGIGFAPTTTQGIQLTAGAGLTFDAFCPTGGVWWLSSTTGSNFSILEG
jgi:hypothetical protein